MPTLDLISLLTNYSTLNNECSAGSADELDSIDTSEDQDSASSSLTTHTSASGPTKRSDQYFRKSRELKLDKENLFSMSFVKPIPVEETFSFDLNKNTKFLNMFMWTVQCQAKAGKQKNLLIGYITMPVNELNVDCWMTSKGETQTTAYFKPLEELKAASIISRITRSHVVSDHPGFDPNMSVGTLTLNVNHRINTSTSSAAVSAPPPTRPPPPVSSSIPAQQTRRLVPTISVSESEEHLNEENRNSDECAATSLGPVVLDEKELVNGIGESLVEKSNIETEIKRKIADGSFKSLDEADDGSMHKFLSVQFNENVMCAFCNKKVRLILLNNFSR